MADNFLLRLPKSLHKHAARLAKRDGVTLDEFLLSAIAARVGAEEALLRIERETANGDLDESRAGR